MEIFVSCLGFIVLSRVSVYNVHSIRYDTSYCHIFNFNVPILSTRSSIHFHSCSFINHALPSSCLRIFMSAASCFFLSVCFCWFKIKKVILLLTLSNLTGDNLHLGSSPAITGSRLVPLPKPTSSLSRSSHFLRLLGFLRQAYLKLIYTHAVLFTVCNSLRSSVAFLQCIAACCMSCQESRPASTISKPKAEPSCPNLGLCDECSPQVRSLAVY